MQSKLTKSLQMSKIADDLKAHHRYEAVVCVLVVGEGRLLIVGVCDAALHAQVLCPAQFRAKHPRLG